MRLIKSRLSICRTDSLWLVGPGPWGKLPICPGNNCALQPRNQIALTACHVTYTLRAIRFYRISHIFVWVQWVFNSGAFLTTTLSPHLEGHNYKIPFTSLVRGKYQRSLRLCDNQPPHASCSMLLPQTVTSYTLLEDYSADCRVTLVW